MTELKHSDLVVLLSELVDECALDKPLDWESLDFDGVKQISILNVIDIFKKFPEAQNIELMTMMAYLLTENTQLWIENQRNSK